MACNRCHFSDEVQNVWGSLPGDCFVLLPCYQAALWGDPASTDVSANWAERPKRLCSTLENRSFFSECKDMERNLTTFQLEIRVYLQKRELCRFSHPFSPVSDIRKKVHLNVPGLSYLYPGHHIHQNPSVWVERRKDKVDRLLHQDARLGWKSLCLGFWKIQWKALRRTADHSGRM